MLIGKAGAATTAISTATAASVTVRGRDLCGDLMGRLGFSQYFFLLLTGQEPTEQQAYFLDLLLVAIAEHGLVPTNQVARMTYDADPGSLQGAVAAGILGCGTVVLGTAEYCGKLLVEAQQKIAGSGQDAAAAMRDIVATIRAAGGKVPGFGHPIHKPLDPRAERILALADAKGVSGSYVGLARQCAAAVAEAWGKPLTMNVSMPIAAVLLDLGFPAAMIKAIPILARTASLLAHLAEEQTNPIGFLMASHAEAAIHYDGEGGALMHDEAVETRGWAAQQAADDVLYRRQVAYLFARSRFYRDKLAGAGFGDVASVGGLPEIARLPFTEKDELRASRSAADPIGTHLAVPMTEVARIYSTSGTTGTPSYIPLTRGDLANWIETSCRSYGASGVTRGDRIVSTYNAGPFVAGAALEAFTALGLCQIPVGTGNTERLMAAVQLLGPDTIALTPSYALHLAEWAAARGIDLANAAIKRVLVAGEPGGGEPAFRARLEAAWGATVTEAMGIGDISVSLWGECEEQAGMHFSGRGFVHFELIDPDTGQPVAMTDGAEGELVYTHLQGQAAPLLRFRSRDHVKLHVGPCRCGRTAPRVRCIGRTDDMLIVRGVNVFPTAIREVVAGFAPRVTGVISVRPRAAGFRQDPPLPVVVELADGEEDTPEFASQIRQKLRDVLLFAPEIQLVPAGTLPRTDYKSKLVDRSHAAS